MSSFELVLAFLLDIFLGDPSRIPHPVRWMGRLIEWLEGKLRRHVSGPAAERVAGIFLALGVAGTVYSGTYYLIDMALGIHESFGTILTIYLAYTTLSVKSLQDAARTVYRDLANDRLGEARKHLSALVGRRTDTLDEMDSVQAAVESVAENASDGVVAPLLYLALGGVPLAMAYKAINTLDSMVGYKTPKYANIGWASARIDDLANYVPARLTALAIALVGVLSGSGLRPLKIMIRDGHKHESPNSGFPEAAMAGCLGISLGGGRCHPDKPGVRAILGDPMRSPTSGHIVQSIRILYGVSFLVLLAVVGVRLWYGT